MTRTTERTTEKLDAVSHLDVVLGVLINVEALELKARCEDRHAAANDQEAAGQEKTEQRIPTFARWEGRGEKIQSVDIENEKGDAKSETPADLGAEKSRTQTLTHVLRVGKSILGVLVISVLLAAAVRNQHHEAGYEAVNNTHCKRGFTVRDCASRLIGRHGHGRVGGWGDGAGASVYGLRSTWEIDKCFIQGFWKI